MKNTLLLFLFIFQVTAFSQTKNDSITISFNNETISQSLKKLEEKQSISFYYDTKWLESEKKTITENFNNSSLENILSALFANTSLNYFVDNNKVILSQNRIVYDYFVDNYFKPESSKNTNATDNSSIQQKNDISNFDNDIIYIGKQKRGNTSSKHTLSGYIKNIETNEPLKNVKIKVNNKNIETSTDDNGFYSLEVPTGTHIIVVQTINAKGNNKKIFISENGTLDFNISQKTIGIKEIIITNKIQTKIKTSVVGATSIDLENMKNVPVLLGEQDVFKIATIMPGIKTTGEGSSGLNVRGGNADQNLILVDDISLYNPFHFLGFFSSINPYSLKSVTIYKGSIPVEYGGRLSSVIDLKTKKPTNTKLSGEGGIGPVTSNLFVNVPVVKNKSAIIAGFRATYSDWILKSLKDEQLKKSSASFYDFFTKYSHEINENNTINASLYYSDDKFKITSDSLFNYNNRLLGINWEHKFSKKMSSQLLLNNSDYKYGVNYSNQNDNRKSFESGFNINESNAQLKFENKLNGKFTVNYGLSAKLYKINPGFLNPKEATSLIVPVNLINEKALEASAYLKTEAKLTEKLLINVGGRYTTFNYLGENTQRIYEEGLPRNEATLIETKQYKHNEVIKQYGGFEPRVSARYMLTNSLSTKIGYDKTYQYIHLLSTNTTQSPTDIWKLSDINVKPQIGEQFSIGFYKNLNETYEISLEGYTKKSKNILDYKTGANIVLSNKIETELLQGEGKSYGVELLIKKNIGKLNGWIAYTYSRSFLKLDSQFRDERVNDGEYFASNFDKPHDFNSVLNYKITKRYSFSLNFVYQTGRPITYPIGKYTYANSEYTLYSDRNKFRIPDYYRVDVSFNIEGSHKIKKLAHSFWNISIYNVLGRNNPYSIYFISNDGQVKGYKTSIFAIPIPTITYNFKF
ncbi:TonB-dependent receptor [Flavobacterium terrigena]|uniref:Outer membrane receptor proteins, mostly Fe transport n=1 Tax=Flavobacterium terrigena TaxID=402734 RepID=A0A1H6X3E5_9FLAO|nr:carboxypeptidase-like regulatory domain-containing protein [Flavobacterium terrigena]SEJ19570.1 Outer membrane receptor proteins, mostly Fe transport [Flavobacterium terrigena]